MASVRSYPISGHHRVEMCRIMADKTDWIEASSYEAQARGFINFPSYAFPRPRSDTHPHSLTRHTTHNTNDNTSTNSVARYHAEYVAEHVQEKVRVMYLGGADLIEKYACFTPVSCFCVCGAC